MTEAKAARQRLKCIIKKDHSEAVRMQSFFLLEEMDQTSDSYLKIDLSRRIKALGYIDPLFYDDDAKWLDAPDSTDLWDENREKGFSYMSLDYFPFESWITGISYERFCAEAWIAYREQR